MIEDRLPSKEERDAKMFFETLDGLLNSSYKKSSEMTKDLVLSLLENGQIDAPMILNMIGYFYPKLICALESSSGNKIRESLISKWCKPLI